MKLRNCNLKDNWYCEDNIGKDAAGGVAARELDSLVRLKSREPAAGSGCRKIITRKGLERNTIKAKNKTKKTLQTKGKKCREYSG